MAYYITRAVLVLLSIVVLIVIIKRFSAQLKKPVIFIIAIALLGVSIYPTESLFLTFSSPEGVYRYNKPFCEPTIVLEGKNSAMMVRDGADGKSDIMFSKRTKNGWKKASVLSAKNYLGFDSGTIIQMMKWRSGDDWYIKVEDSISSALEVSDNQCSDFSESEKYTRFGVSYCYYAYIGKIDLNTYTIVVNDHSIDVGKVVKGWLEP